jgi:hypothetical protein
MELVLGLLVEHLLSPSLALSLLMDAVPWVALFLKNRVLLS